ncbi:MAG: c-type cytochrome biosis protein CcmI [Nevskia sp.]|nr:c-type cytochrome biosis protein CcmI [Nevskia sp.]
MTPALWFGVAIAALFVFAFALTTRPWWLRSSSRVRRQRANVAAYQTRLAEIEIESAAGLIEATEAEALKQELAVRLLADADAGSADAVLAPVSRPRIWTIVAAGLLLALFAGGGYWLDGSWRLQQQIASRRLAEPAVAEMIQKLAERLQQQPDDPQAWALLGRSYFVLQRFGDAAKAYRQANARAPAPNAEWLADEGEAIAFDDGRTLDDRSIQLFEQALQLQPDFGKALWYAGLGAAQQNDVARARALWTRLAQQDLPEQMRSVLQERLAALDGAAAPAGSGTTPAANAATAAAVALHLRIVLAPALLAKIPNQATLLVFAKADGGPPMPLAVQRLPGARPPLEVTLDDSQAMTPALKLSQFDRYLVTARLSQGGMAQALSGDLQGTLHLSRADAGKPVLLTIDSIVP